MHRFLCLTTSFFATVSVCHADAGGESAPALITARAQKLIRLAEHRDSHNAGPVKIILKLRSRATTADLADLDPRGLLNWQPSKKNLRVLTPRREKAIRAAISSSEFGNILQYQRKQTLGLVSLLFLLNDVDRLGDVVESLRTLHPAIAAVDVERKINALQDVPLEVFQPEPAGPIYRDIQILSKSGENLFVTLMKSSDGQRELSLIGLQKTRAVVQCTEKGLALIQQSVTGKPRHILVTHVDHALNNPFRLQSVLVSSESFVAPPVLAKELAGKGLHLSVVGIDPGLTVLVSQSQLKRLRKFGYKVVPSQNEDAQ